jgi:hypothetical protein
MAESFVHKPFAAETILAQIEDFAAPVLLAIDGHSAAGKSSLARTLQSAHSDATIVHANDFYRPLDLTTAPVSMRKVAVPSTMTGSGLRPRPFVRSGLAGQRGSRNTIGAGTI